jgi:hypothetical protein
MLHAAVASRPAGYVPGCRAALMRVRGAGVEGDQPHSVMIGPRGVSWALEGGTNTIVRVVPADAEATRREAH